MKALIKEKQYLISIIFIVLISCFYFIFYRNVIYFGDDLSFHINRLIGIFDAFKGGQIIPRVYPNINYGYGYGSPFFYCDLFLYPFVLLRFLSVSFVDIYRIIIIFYSTLATINAFYAINKVFKSNRLSIVGASFYVLSSYRLYDVYNRAALGEVIAFAFIPLVLLSIYQVLVLKEDKYVFLSISFSSLVLSHLITSVLLGLMFSFFIIVFFINNFKNKKIIRKVFITIIKAIILAILLCAWFIFPMLEQIITQNFYCFSFGTTFSTYPRIELISNLLNPFNGANLFDISLFVVSLLYIFIKKKNRLINLLLIVVYVFFLIMIGVVPLPSFLNFIQFMFRLNIIIYPFLIIIALYILKNINIINRRLLLIALIFIFGINLFTKYNIILSDKMNNVICSEIDSKITYDPEGYYFNKRQISWGEYLPVCDNADYLNGEKGIILTDVYGNHIDIYNNFIKENGNIFFEYEGDAEFVSLPLTYYKGYTVVYDNIKKTCVDDYLYKRVGFYLEKGFHSYAVYYDGTIIQKISSVLSLITITIIFINYLYKKKDNLIKYKYVKQH